MKTKCKLIFLALISVQSYAGIMPSQSRIVYHQLDRAQAIMLANTNDYPVIVQTWIDKGEGSPDSPNIPFISIPPVTQLASGDMKGVRIIYTQALIPQDRESLFWLNMYEVPPEKKGTISENSMLVTTNTQIKLFYRPKGVIGIPETEFPRLSCHKINNRQISYSNSGPIHLSIISITLETQSGQKLVAENNDFMLYPFSQKIFKFPGYSGEPKQIKAEYIDDNGQRRNYITSIKRCT
ncbi:molecular chaperone [Escherichia albertii]|uniref:fimbrial biogenesis chaperone n=1 Tax=Escherichia albertii TaxID=208962 RepID=UPI000743703D|nr:molecular chaperone [Escherichia albertii]EGQ0034749.1 molecular chaperone [Escherichia albertii]MCZ8825225.1 molecular chaperone [Escherichia albertii]MCZ8876590.1 molecular chaperone [Escherichia albertii]MCZ8993584.1 molecular chaperone [Escherichia albertii]MCZ9188401.1 molecular chaperone [Escherichia albertii]